MGVTALFMGASFFFFFLLLSAAFFGGEAFLILLLEGEVERGRSSLSVCSVLD